MDGQAARGVSSLSTGTGYQRYFFFIGLFHLFRELNPAFTFFLEPLFESDADPCAHSSRIFSNRPMSLFVLLFQAQVFKTFLFGSLHSCFSALIYSCPAS